MSVGVQQLAVEDHRAARNEHIRHRNQVAGLPELKSQTFGPPPYRVGDRQHVQPLERLLELGILGFVNCASQQFQSNHGIDGGEMTSQQVVDGVEALVGV